MKRVKRVSCLTMLLYVVFAASSVLAEPKFGTDIPSVRRAFRGGKIEEALAYYESLAREREKKALTEGTSKKDWEAISEAYQAASKAALFFARSQKSIIYGHKALEAAERTDHVNLQFRALFGLALAYRRIHQLENSRKFGNYSALIPAV
ncbi:MAG: hypothetical protein O7G28_03220 [Deltaproteobacteria bacterium]|nr:hypothetical protein [Deltaproteobacteria bacterium]